MPVSLLGLGCMRLPVVGGVDKRIDYEKAQEIVDYAFKNGINYFDTAHGYHGGQSQVFLGEALSRYPRESYYLATKMPMWSVVIKKDLGKIFALQQERLKTDCFDFYLLHSMDKGNYKKAVKFGAYEFLSKMKAQGKIKNIGFSFHDSPELLEEIAGAHAWDFAQLQINYVDWKNQKAKEQYEILEKYNIPCIVMEPVRGGSLAAPGAKAVELLKAAAPDKSVASWAIRYAASLPNVLTVLSGMSNMEQIRDNIATMADFQPLTEQELQIVEAAAEAYNLKDVIPCTACRYCMDCPSGVDIPRMFAVFNDYQAGKDKEKFLAAYKDAAKQARAENCAECGTCAPRCPQLIDIPEKLKTVAALHKKLS